MTDDRLARPDRLDRAVGAVRGLALGDALGAPASEHRTVRDPWVREMLRKGALGLDESRVLRPVVPFVLTAIDSPPLVATDDTESFAATARVLLDAPTWADDDLFDTWLALVDSPETWTGPAQRSALLNAAAGLRPPQTGIDNPAFYDDTALPGALAIALATADPAQAAELARRYATITHDGIGVHAAVVFARLVSRLLAGAPLRDALDAVVEDLSVEDLSVEDPAIADLSVEDLGGGGVVAQSLVLDRPVTESPVTQDLAATTATATATAAAADWLADGVRDALRIVDQVPSPFAAVPALVARFAPRTYSHPGTVAETLPLAVAITAVTRGDHETALPLALAITRHQDSLPALVGALCGAAGSAPASADLDVLHGVTIPAVAGQSLAGLAEALVTRAS